MKKALKILEIMALSSTLSFGNVATAAEPSVEPELTSEARTALETMSVYLRGLKSFELAADLTSEEVLDSGEKLQFAGKLTYVASLPNKLFGEVSSDRQQRQFFYDGSKVTIFAPRLGYYTDAPVSGDVVNLLNIASDKYGIDLPLQDLFLWGAPNRPATMPTSGRRVGPATVDGIAATQYAFRQPGVDWQIWIADGVSHRPLRLVITDRLDDARPQFTAALKWTENPRLAAEKFSFVPNPAATRIALTDLSSGDPK